MSTQVLSRVTGQVGASLTLMGVVAISVLATQPGLSTDRNTTATTQMQPVPVRIVDAPVAANKDCAEQTWPYIESRC